MDDWGLSELGFRRPAYADILDAYEQRAKALFGSDINLSVRSILGMLLRMFAWFSGLAWQLAEDVYNAGYVDTAVGISLARIGAIIGIRPYSAQKATGELVFTGTAGQTIPAGLIVSATNKARFITLAAAVIGADGMATVSAQAYEVGPDGNAAASTIRTIVTPITGIDTINNAMEFVGGRYRETEAEFRARYYRAARRASGANTDAIREEILTVPGVQQAKVRDNVMDETDADGLPAHSIEAVVYGGQDLQIAKSIWSRKAAGIQTHGTTSITMVDASGNTQIIKFSRPTNVPVYIRITGLSIADGFEANDVQTRLSAALIAYVRALGVGVSVMYVRLIAEASAVDGIADYTLELSGDGSTWGISNIAVTARQTVTTDGDKVVFVS